MSKEYYIRLTLGVYRVSQLFPEKEPLKDKIRQLAEEILANLLCGKYKNCSGNIKLIQNLFILAESRGLADSRNFLVLSREYAKIAEFIENMRADTGKTVENSSQNAKNKNRQDIILTILQNNGRVKVGDLTKSFPNINRRTLLRDLDIFCQSGLVEKSGGGRGACYTIRNATL